MEFQFEACKKLMKYLFGWRYPPEEDEPYCRRYPIAGKTLPDKIKEILEDLRKTHNGERKRQIIILWFGLETGQTQSMRKIGLIFRVTAGRIEQIRNATLRYLGRPSRSNELKPYLESFSFGAAMKMKRQKKREELQQTEKKSKQENIRAFRQIYEKTLIVTTLRSKKSEIGIITITRIINRIKRSGIRYCSDLKTSNVEKLVKNLKMSVPNTMTEQCLREIWKIANQKS